MDVQCLNFPFNKGMKQDSAILILLNILLLVAGASAIATLKPGTDSVNENDSLTLTCLSNDTNIATVAYWFFANYTNVIMGIQSGACLAYAPLNNLTMYELFCAPNNTFVVKILHVKKTQHLETWRCNINNKDSNNVTIYVKAKDNNPEPSEPRERRCLACWIYVTISSGCSLVTLLAVQIVLVSFDNVKTRPWTAYRIGVAVVLTAQVAVTLASGLCKEEENCEENICVPCWVYCLMLTVLTITCVPLILLVKAFVENKHNMHWIPWGTAKFGILGAVYIAVVLSAAYCKVRSTPVDQIHRWIYGVVLFIIFFTMVTLAAIIRDCCGSDGIVRLAFWELALCIGASIFVTTGLAFTILVGHFRNSIDTGRLSLAHWEIYLIVVCIFVICWTIATFIYIVQEPVCELRVNSKRVTDKTMEVQLQWKCRLSKYKKCFVQLEHNASRQSPEEEKCRTMDHEEGIMQYTLIKLKLDTNYKIIVYSSISGIPSRETEIQIDTKVPLPEPTDLHVLQKTDTSLTLSWKHTCGRATNYVIECRRTKAANKTKRILKSKETVCTVEGLRPKTSYTIEVYAENKLSKSTKVSINEKTRAPKPEPPSDFKYTSVSEEDITLQWKPCQNVNKQKFRLTYISDDSKDTKLIEYDGSKVMVHTVSGLDPGTNYLFDLVAKVGKMTSESSAVLSVTTKGTRKDMLTSSNTQNMTTMFLINSQNGQWTKHV